MNKPIPKNNPQRPEELQQVINLLKSIMTATALQPEPAYTLSQRIFAALDNQIGTINTHAPQQLQACEHLDTAFENLRKGPEPTQPLAYLLHKLEKQLIWRHRSHAPNLLGYEDQNIANTILVGNQGLEQRDDILIGMTIMAPHTLFNDHNHPPEEVYAILSAGYWRQNNNAWLQPGIGNFVYNPADIMHAFKSDNSPVLVIWCL